MLILRDRESVRVIADPGVREVADRWYTQLCAAVEDYDPGLHGYAIVVEPGDRIDDLESESGCPLLHDLFGEARFGDPDFRPLAEAIEEHATCFELVFILNDDGYGIELLVPKADGVDPELLAMCKQFAVPAPDLAQP